MARPREGHGVRTDAGASRTRRTGRRSSGHAGADVTPLATEFLVEARSGGTCVVRVVSSAYGTGADWENEFWGEMDTGWAPMLDNLRIYLTHFAGQRATATTSTPRSP